MDSTELFSNETKHRHWAVIQAILFL